MLIQDASVLCFKINDEYVFINIEKSEIFWKLKRSSSEGDCEDAKEKSIRKLYYF